MSTGIVAVAVTTYFPSDTPTVFQLKLTIAEPPCTRLIAVSGVPIGLNSVLDLLYVMVTVTTLSLKVPWLVTLTSMEMISPGFAVRVFGVTLVMATSWRSTTPVF
jgi:hypothetical protein